MSTGRPLGAVVLAAGLGTRMRSARAKVLHELGGRPLVRYPLDALATLAPDRGATEAERAVTEINPGLYCVRSEVLFPLLAELRPDNDQGELYLTDLVGLAARAGQRVRALRTERADEVAGINTRAELAAMEASLKAELTDRWMAEGVT